VVLLIDSDLAFTFALGRALDQAGYEAVPARNTRDASKLTTEHALSITVLVIDPFLAGAIPFISRLRKHYSGLKSVAALPPEGGELRDLTAFSAYKRKPRFLTADAVGEWVRLIHGLTQRAGGADGGGV
jgi:DNA-binding response OmpR family regulator